jgi:uncharacterized protein YneF (UPF0154 family)
MTSGHIFYIPISLLIGLILGYYWGRAAEEKEQSRHNDRSSESEGRRHRRRRERD